MASPSQASLLLQKQLKDLCKNPVDGFSAGLVDETNIFEWGVIVIGPPDTLYSIDHMSCFSDSAGRLQESASNMYLRTKISHTIKTRLKQMRFLRAMMLTNNRELSSLLGQKEDIGREKGESLSTLILLRILSSCE